MKITLSLLTAVLFWLPTADAAPPLRIKNFREILASYESVLGIPAADTEIRETFRMVQDRLPRLGLPQEFGSPTVLALTELSGVFCKKAIDREKVLPIGERNLFVSVDFERGPVQFGEFASERMMNALAMTFWQRETTAEERAVFSKLIMSASQVDPQAKVETEKVLRLMCTSFATSLAFLVK